MSKIPHSHPPSEEVHVDKGELRKPMDRHWQPEQGGDLTPPNPGRMNPRTDQAAREELDPAGLQLDPPRP